MTYTLFIVDDHKIVRDGLKALLLGKSQIQVIGEAASAQELRMKMATMKPDLVFVDLKLPDANGSELISEMAQHWPDARFALLTADPNPIDLKRAQKAGTLAFLTKDMETSEYFEAIDRMIAGRKFISPTFSEVLLEEPTNYTPREIEVLHGFAKGLTYKEIAAELGMSPRTVETHKNHLLEKMQVRSIVEMVRRAIRDGLVQA